MADFSGIFTEIKNQRQAAFVYQRGGRARFRDRLVLGRNGKVFFQRFNYGEAAGLVFQMWGEARADTVHWQHAGVNYGKKDEAPTQLTGSGEAGSLLFDGSTIPWEPQAPLKVWPQGGLGRLKMLLGG